MKYHYEDENVKVSVFLINKDNIIARANISIKLNTSYFITIKGFVIWKSEWIHPKFQEQLNITPPRIYRFGKWVDIVFFESKNDWILLEEKIYSAYLKAKLEKDNKLIVNENINPDDIPI
jgi:hypothetical protein